MAFLAGMYGRHGLVSCCSKIENSVALRAAENSVSKIQLEHGVVFMGYKKEEEYHHDRLIVLPDGQGALVGRLFDFINHAPATLTRDEARMVCHAPEQFCKRWWGRYSGVLYNTEQKILTIICDPQGLLNLYYIDVPEGLFFSTDMRLLYDMLPSKPAVNFNYFAEYIINENWVLPSTPLKGIQELEPGMGLTVYEDGHSTKKLLWDVAGIQSTFIKDENVFEEKLLATLKGCINAWAQEPSGICVELSGGTDSTGLLILLRDLLPDKKIMAINLMDSKNPSSNEIQYAQEVADLCNVPLYFVDWQNTSLIDPLPVGWFQNRPNTLSLYYNMQQEIHDLKVQHGCLNYMDGQGGDHVFVAPMPKRALADYYLQRGLRGIMQPLKELSATYRMSWTGIMRDTAQDVYAFYRKKHKNCVHTDQKKLLEPFDQRFAQMITRSSGHLDAVLKNFYPAKGDHIKSLYHATLYGTQRTPQDVMTSPILSQPIVELALQIPTYQSFKDNYDRVFFRRAVSRVAKPKALWRRIKGQTTTSMVKECQKQAPFMREMLNNGLLVKSGMIDKAWLNTHLAKAQHGQGDNLWPLLHLLTGQIWLNQWGL
jgi:asparagine synthase (glutamine-hydrolysing)